MKVKVAETAGFCFGVQAGCRQGLSADRGVELSPIYTLGQSSTMKKLCTDLESRGVQCDLK